MENKRVPKEHSIIKLYNLVKDDIKMSFSKRIFTNLEEVYMDSRYPGDLGLLHNGKPTLAEAKEFYDFAKRVYAKIEDIIK